MRPLLLSILCLFSFVYFGLLTLFFSIGAFYSGWITTVTNQYLPGEEFTKTGVLAIFFAIAAFHALAFAGTIYIWKLRKAGYYMLGAACLAITSYQLTQPRISLTTTAVYIALILLFGFFIKKYR
jgi:hypothetical protein